MYREMQPTADRLVAERIGEFTRDLQPVNVIARIAVEQAAMASFQIKHCDDEINALREEHKDRAAHVWNIDRAAEAAYIALHLRKRPVAVVSKLMQSAQGVQLLLRYWDGIRSCVQRNGDLDTEKRAVVHDLLGNAAQSRSGAFFLDPEDTITDRRAFMLARIDEVTSDLKELLEKHLMPLDERKRLRACAGMHLTTSKELSLALRYQREAIHRYNSALEVVRSEAARHPIGSVVIPIESQQDTASAMETPPEGKTRQYDLIESEGEHQEEREYDCRDAFILEKLPKAPPEIIEQRHHAFLKFLTSVDDDPQPGQHRYIELLLTLDSSVWTADELAVAQMYCPTLA